jgi:hypothetical protein
MSATDLPTVTAGTWTRRLPTALVSGGLLTMAAGLVAFRAGEELWLGARRSANYFGPAMLLSSDSNPRGPIVVGAIVSTMGFAVFLLGLFDATSRVDDAARVVRARTPAAARHVGTSTYLVSGGLLGLAIGYATDIVQTPLLLATGHYYSESTRNGVGAIGVAVSIIGLAALLVGLHRLVVNINCVTNDPLG